MLKSANCKLENQESGCYDSVQIPRSENWGVVGKGGKREV